MEDSGLSASSAVHMQDAPLPPTASLSFLAPPVTRWLTAGAGAAVGRPGGSVWVSLRLRTCGLLGGVIGALSRTLGRVKPKVVCVVVGTPGHV